MENDNLARAFNYPYKQEDCSFIFLNGNVYPVSNYLNFSKSRVTCQNEIVDLNHFLKTHNLNYLDIDNCNLVLAYGSNSSMEQLTRKFSEKQAFIPVLKSTIKGIDVVYSAHITSYGSLPATIQGAIHNTANIFVTLLNDKLLHRMHETEALGKAYHYIKLKDIKLNIGNELQLNEIYSYLSIPKCLNINNSSVALKSIVSSNREIPDYFEPEVLSQVINLLNIDDLSPEMFVDKLLKSTEYRLSINKKLLHDSISYKDLNYEVI